MDPVNMKTKFTQFFSQYKYVILVVVIGLILMSLPTQGKKDEVESTITPNQKSSDTEQKLENILAQIEGVGKVQVLLTLSEGERVLYESNEDSTFTDQTNSKRQDTVIIVDSNRTESGLVQQIIPPVYLGAVVVCQGGDKPSVKLSVVEAVSNATGLSADRISVLKMK